MERFVVVDLAAKTWYFSFSGQNPQDDECAWTGGEGDNDITPMSARVAGTCPFCGDGSKVTKSVLLIRSTGKEWAVTTPSGTFTPSNTEQVADVSSRAIRTATCDTEVKIPEFILSTDSEDFEITLPESASVYVSNGNSVIKINTNGNKNRKPIKFNKNKVEVGNKDTTVTVATDNVVAQVNSDQAAFTIDENLINIDFGNSQTPVVVDEKKPQVIVENTAGAAPTVTETESLVSVVPTVKPELQPEQVKPGLTAPDARDLTNPSYVAAVSLVPTTPVVAPPVTTIASTTSTTLKKTTTSSTTTTTTTTQAPSDATDAPPVAVDTPSVAVDTPPPPPTTTTTVYIHPYLRNYGCPYVYVGPQTSGPNTEATGRCNAGWEDVTGTVTFDGITRSVTYSYQFRTCDVVTYSLRVRYSNGNLSHLFTGSYTPPADNC
jgi:hypothetical protein